MVSTDLKYDLLYIVTNGFAARMITQFNLIADLQKSGIKVGIISSDQQDNSLKQYCDFYKIPLLEFNTDKTLFSIKYMFYRNYFLEDLDANHALLEKHIWEIRFDKNRTINKILLAKFCYGLHQIKKFIPGFKHFYLFIEKLLLKSKEADEFIQAHPARYYVSTYPVNNNEAILINAAKKQKYDTVCHLLSWDNVTCKGHFTNIFDAYICWGELMKTEFFEKYNIPSDKLFIAGVSHFDAHRFRNTEKFENSNILNLKNVNNYIFFGMSAPRFVPHEIDIVEYLCKQVENNIYGNKTCIIIRPHPQNVTGDMADPQWINRLQALQSERCILFMPELNTNSNLLWSMSKNDMEYLTYALKNSAVCINSCSTISIDALMCGVGNIAPLFDGDAILEYWKSAKRLTNYTHIKKFINLGGTELVSNYEELNLLILQYLENKNYNLSKREHALHKECNITAKGANHETTKIYLQLLKRN